MAAAARIEAQEGGVLAVSGVLEFATVTALAGQAEGLLPASGPLYIDLGGVEHTDSAGLALLVHWLRRAHHEGRLLEFRNVPVQLLEMARVSRLDNLLPLRAA
jgi:phospholipid transport system transporter-binding protein